MTTRASAAAGCTFLAAVLALIGGSWVLSPSSAWATETTTTTTEATTTTTEPGTTTTISSVESCGLSAESPCYVEPPGSGEWLVVWSLLGVTFGALTGSVLFRIRA